MYGRWLHFNEQFLMADGKYIYIVSKGWVFGASIDIINTKQHLLVKVLSIKLAPFTFPSPVPGTQLKLDITGQCF